MGKNTKQKLRSVKREKSRRREGRRPGFNNDKFLGERKVQMMEPSLPVEKKPEVIEKKVKEEKPSTPKKGLFARLLSWLASKAVTKTEVQVESVEDVSQELRRRLSISKLLYRTRQLASLTDAAYNDYKVMLSDISVLETEIADKTLTKEELSEKKAQLKALKQKAELQLDKAESLERASDEYAYIYSLVTETPEPSFRKTERINEKHIDLTEEQINAVLALYQNPEPKKTTKVVETEKEKKNAYAYLLSFLLLFSGDDKDVSSEKAKRSAGIVLVLLLIIILLLVIFGVKQCSTPAEAEVSTVSVAKTEEAVTPASAEETAVSVESEVVASAESVEAVAETTAPEEDKAEEVTISTTEVTVAVDNKPVEAVKAVNEPLLLESTSSYAVFQLPAFIGNAEVEAFMLSEASKYGSMLDGVTYTIDGDKLIISYPELSEAERSAALEVLTNDYAAFLTGEAEDTSAKTEETKAETTVAIEEKEELSSLDDFKLYEKTFGVYGDEIVVTAYDGNVVISYPNYISKAEIAAFIEEESAKYGLFEGYSYYFTEDGEVVITYPEGTSADDIKYAIAVLAEDAEEKFVEPASAATETLPVSVTEETKIEETTVENLADETKIEETVIDVPAIGAEEEAVTPVTAADTEEEWEPVKHSFSLYVSPYTYSIFDFYNARTALSNAGLTIGDEFSSKYGFGFMGGYNWNFMENLSVGIETGYMHVYPKRSALEHNTVYHHIPVLAKFSFNIGGEHLGFIAGVGAGIDIASLSGNTGCYFMASLDLGMSYRFAENWSLMLRSMATLSLQNVPSDPIYSSMTYMIHPVSVGISFHI